MIKTNSKKVCIVVSSLGGGGAERSSAYLSEILFDLGYDVHIVSVLNIIEYPYKGKLLNLGELKENNDFVFGRLQRLNVFRKYLKAHSFDYVIDNRTRIGFLKELIINKYLYAGLKTIYTVHSFKTSNYLPANKALARLLYSNAYKIAAVSEAIQVQLKDKYNLNNVVTINNVVEINEKTISKTQANNDYVLFYGRLDDEVKNLTLLLHAFKTSDLKTKSIMLKIMGTGKDLDYLKQTADQLEIIHNIEFLDYQPNPYKIVANAMFTVLTSRYEGFPMVIPESLALGVPVVSVDCKSGPSEIIINEYNGLLVENHNIHAFAQAMNRMVNDKDLYLRCRFNAKLSITKLSKEEIGKQWQSLLK